MKMPAMSVRFVVGADVRAEDERVDEGRQLRRQRVLAEQRRVHFGRGAAVEILVLDRDQAFVEERIALARDLDEVDRSVRRRRLGPRILTRRRLVVA